MDDTIFDCRHPPGAVGTVEDPRGLFNEDERRIADRHAGEGHTVKAVPAGTKHGRTPDSDTCGHKTEFKTIQPLQPGRETPPESRVRNILGRRSGQGTHLALDATADPRIKQDHADLGVRMFLSDEAKAKAEGKLVGGEREAIRVYGQDFDISYGRARVQEIRREQTRSQQRSGAVGHQQGTASTTRSEEPTPSRSRFSIGRTEGRSVEPDRESRRSFDTSRGDEGGSPRKGPSK